MKIPWIIPAVVAISILPACAGHSYRLSESSTPELTAGSFKHSGTDERAVALEFDGKQFETRRFAVHRSQNLAELRRRYGAGSKHYERIFSGLDTDHYVYSAHPDLHSDNGATMQCSFAWKAFGVPAGSCMTAEGKAVDVRFE